LFATAFAARLAYIAATPSGPGKPWEAVKAAISLAAGGPLGNVYFDGSGPSAHVSPLFPFALAAIIRLCGGWNAASQLMARLLAALSASFAVALLPGVSRACGWGPRAGTIAACVLIVLPLHWRTDTLSLWEAPHAALMFELLFLAVLRLHAAPDVSRKDALKFGLLLGLAGLLSCPVYVAGAGAFVGAMASDRDRRRRLLPAGIAAAAVSALVMAPWIVRNLQALGGSVVFRSNFGLELRVGNSDGADGRFRTTVKRFHPSRPHRAREYADLGELEFMRRRQQEATDWILSNPARFLRLCLARAGLVWFAPPRDWSANRGPAVFKSVVNGAVSALALGMLAWLCVTRAPLGPVFVGAVLGFTAVYYVTHVNQRYIYPMFWLSALLAARFVEVTLWNRLARRRDRSPQPEAAT
jgi:hypothetical protein